MDETLIEKSEPVVTTGEDNQLPAVDHTQDLQEIKDALELMQEQAQTQLEAPEVVTGIDQFVIDNGALIVEVLSLAKWWLFIGVPLICVISFFWIVYNQFLYTKN